MNHFQVPRLAVFQWLEFEIVCYHRLSTNCHSVKIPPVPYTKPIFNTIRGLEHILSLMLVAPIFIDPFIKFQLVQYFNLKCSNQITNVSFQSTLRICSVISNCVHVVLHWDPFIHSIEIFCAEAFIYET